MALTPEEVTKLNNAVSNTARAVELNTQILTTIQNNEGRAVDIATGISTHLVDAVATENTAGHVKLTDSTTGDEAVSSNKAVTPKGVNEAILTALEDYMHVVGEPIIAGQDYCSIGLTTTFTLSASGIIEGATIDSFSCTFVGETRTVTAVNNEAKVTFTIPSTYQEGETLTFVATAKDNFGNISKRSTHTLTTIRTYISKPTVTQPFDSSEIAIAYGLNATLSAFEVIGGTDTYTGSDFYIYSDSACTHLVASRENNDSRVYQFPFADLSGLSANNVYYIRGRHHGTILSDSALSDPVPFSIKAAYVDKPTITSPASGNDIYYSNGIEVSTSDFSVVYGEDTHLKTTWIISAQASGNEYIVKESSTTDLTSHVFNNLFGKPFEDNTIYYIRVIYTGTQFGDSEPSANITFKAKRSFVNQPNITSPSSDNTTICFTNGITVSASQFGVTGDSDNHFKTIWQIFSVSGDTFTEVVKDESTEDLTQHTFTGLDLLDGGTYALGVTYVGATFGNSLMSNYRKFIAQAGYVNTPTLAAPTANAVIVFNDTGVTLTTDAFGSTGVEDTHKSTSYRITADASGNNVVASANNVSNLTSYTFTDVSLISNVTYYAWAKFTGNSLGDSAWSDPVPFTAYQGVVNVPVITTPSANDTTLIFSAGIDVETSNFGSTNSADTHKKTTWKLYEVDGETYTEIKSDESTTDLTSHKFTNLSLTDNGTYAIGVIFTGNKFGDSQMSAYRIFTAQAGYVLAPALSAPTTNQDIVFNYAGVTLTTTSEFQTYGDTDTLKDVSWKITSDSNGSVVVVEANHTSDLTSHTFINLTLSNNTTYYAWVRFTGNKLGDSDWNAGVPFKAILGTVSKPTISTPNSNGLTIQFGNGIQVTTSQFTSTNSLDVHSSTIWKLYSVSGSTYTAIKTDTSNTELTSHTFTDLDLTDNATYAITVTHIGQKFGNSEQSDYRTFTAQAAYVNTPSITSPANDAQSDATDDIEVHSSDLSVTGGTATHNSSSWKLTSDSAGNTIVAHSDNNTSAKTSYTFTGLSLTVDKTYYLFVKYHTSIGDSAWSSGVSIKITEKSNLEVASWTRISQIGAAGTGASYFDIGDRKSVKVKGTVGTQEVDNTYYVTIIEFNYRNDKGIYFQCFDDKGGKHLCLRDSHGGSSSTDGSKWFNMNHSNNTNAGGWKGCDMRYDILGSTKTKGADAVSNTATSPVANTLMAALPSDLRAVMKPWTIYSDNRTSGTGTASDVSATVDYLPLLANNEVFGAQNYSNAAELNYTTQMALYKNGSSRIRYSQIDGSSVLWWLRSAYSGSTSSSCAVVNNGGANYYNAYFSFGVSPAFKIA